MDGDGVPEDIAELISGERTRTLLSMRGLAPAGVTPDYATQYGTFVVELRSDGTYAEQNPSGDDGFVGGRWLWDTELQLPELTQTAPASYPFGLTIIKIDNDAMVRDGVMVKSRW